MGVGQPLVVSVEAVIRLPGSMTGKGVGPPLRHDWLGTADRIGGSRGPLDMM